MSKAILSTSSDCDTDALKRVNERLMKNLPAQITDANAGELKKDFSILVVASNPEVERLMQVMLKTSGFGCYFAPKGAVGLAMFEATPTDIVIISTQLPDRNGFEVCLKLRKKSTVPILMITPKRNVEEELRGLKVGADAYLEEPFNSRIVMAHLVAQLRRTYKYNGQPKNSLRGSETEIIAAQKAPTAPGWASCDACHYMGPQSKFEKVSSEGDAKIICPHCGSEQRTGFEIRDSFT